MIIKELKLPFPFYASRNRQHRFRKSCRGQLISGLLTPNDKFLPFQARFEGSPSPLPTVAGASLYNVCQQGATAGQVITDESFVPITDELGNPLTTEPDTLGPIAFVVPTGIFSVVAHNEGYNLVYTGAAHGLTIPCGFYEMNITLSNGASVWSEVFQITEYPAIGMPFMKIEWANTSSLERVYYGAGYTNWLYLDSFLGHSEPQYTEEVEKDGIDTEVVVFSKITNRFIFSEVVPDFLLSAMASIPVCREIILTDPHAEISMDVTRARFTSNTEAAGCFSFIEMQLEVDDEMYRTACD